MRKNIIMDTFMISNGLEFRTDWSSNLLSNWQSYNDTPIAFDVPWWKELPQGVEEVSLF